MQQCNKVRATTIKKENEWIVKMKTLSRDTLSAFLLPRDGLQMRTIQATKVHI